MLQKKLDGDLIYSIQMMSNTPAKVYLIDRLRAYQGLYPTEVVFKSIRESSDLLRDICYIPYVLNLEV